MHVCSQVQGGLSGSVIACKFNLCQACSKRVLANAGKACAPQRMHVALQRLACAETVSEPSGPAFQAKFLRPSMSGMFLVRECNFAPDN